MRRVLWGTLIALAVLVDGFFALVNFYPVAPQRDRGPSQKILVSLETSQAKWLTETLLAEFNDEHTSNLELEIVPDEQLLATLEKEKSSLVAAVLPRAEGARAIASGAVRSFADVASPDQMKALLEPLAEQVVSAVQVDGKPYFVPRAALLDIMVYRISRVRDAVRHWSLLRTDIDAALKQVNGRGLPPGYSLELAPEEWDSYDRFVVAYYWAHRRYEGQPAKGRVGHRTGDGLDNVIEHVEAAYRAGATDATAGALDSAPVRDATSWERLYRTYDLFSPAMMREKPLDDEGVFDALKSGELYLATINQTQAFLLHGGSHRGTPPRIADPDDLAFAPLTRISSQELASSGHPMRKGRRFSFREDWVWMLPSGSPAPQLAFDLAEFLLERDQHVRECEALGALPLRTDVIRERSAIFKLPWMTDIFDAAFDEWKDASPVPERVPAGLGAEYAKLWKTIDDESAKAPPVATPAPDAGTSQSDDDTLDEAEDELWRGKVALEPRAR